MKKILVALSFLFILVSCRLEVAEGQFKRGEYVESIESAIRYIDRNGINDLKDKEKETLISNFNFIEKHYDNKLRPSNTITSAEANFKLWDIFTLVDGKDYFNEYTNFTYKYNPNTLLSNAVNTYYYSIMKEFRTNEIVSVYRDLDKLSAANARMKKKNTSSTKYEDIYKVSLKNEVDILIRLAEMEMRKGNKVKAKDLYYRASNVYKEYEHDYRGVYTKYTTIDKEINIEEGKKYYQKALELYDREKYSEALENFQKAESRFSKYNEFDKEVKQIGLYMADSREKLKYIEAEKYYQMALSEIRRNTKESYKRAVEYFEKVNTYVYNYKNSNYLLNQYKQLTKTTYELTTNNTERYREIRSMLNAKGWGESTSYLNNPDYVINYNERSYYDEQKDRDVVELYYRDYNGNHRYYENTTFITEILTIEPRLFVNNKTISMKPIVIRNVYKEVTYTGDKPYDLRNMIIGKKYGKNGMLNMASKQVATEVAGYIK